MFASKPGEIEMRSPYLNSTAFTLAAALATAIVSSPAPAQSSNTQAQQDQQGQDQQPTPPKPYEKVSITLPQSVQDPSFETFRNKLGDIAQKKDRAALANVVSQNFFWIPEDKDAADKSKSGIQNLSAAIGLEGPDAQGWDMLLDLAAEPTAEPFPGRQGTICAPGEANFDDKAAEQLAEVTQTDPSEWGYPAADGIPVRQSLARNSAVIDHLGLYLVRAYPDDSPSAAVQSDALRIVTPSGKLGYIDADMLRPLLNDQLCYAKEANAWKIVGAIGGSGGDSGPQ
jgi:hypothetical protein